MKLTEEQTAVVALDSGRHLVLAPPGSGKTEMLSQRIVQALKAGVRPEKMLCATFTNRAAFEMRDRVADVSGGLVLPDVGNLHHFCYGFLQTVGKLHADSHIIDEVQQIDFIREVTDIFARELERGKASDKRRTHGITVLGLSGNLSESHVEELADAFLSYNESCLARKRKPCDDILSAVLVSRQFRLGIPSCYLRRMPYSVGGLVKTGAISLIERAYTRLKRKFRCVDFDDGGLGGSDSPFRAGNLPPFRGAIPRPRNVRGGLETAADFR